MKSTTQIVKEIPDKELAQLIKDIKDWDYSSILQKTSELRNLAKKLEEESKISENISLKLAKTEVLLEGAIRFTKTIFK